MSLPETDDPESLKHFRLRCLTDTGFLARNLLGYDYDTKGEEHINVGKGGVRSYGPHQEMVSFIDTEDEFQLLMAPRKTLKSTIAQAYCVRRILLNPNIRILYGTVTDDKAVEFALAIRNALELPQVKSLFGDQKGDSAKDGRPWENDRFTVAGRTNKTLTSPTFRTFSLKTRPVGGRAELIVCDDLIYEETVKTPDAIENAKAVVRMLFPLREEGSKTLVIGTKYADVDLYYELENNPLYKKWVRGAGVRVVQGKNGQLDLELEKGLTEPLFPNLSMDMLRKALHSMSQRGDYVAFSCQYLNVVPAGIGTVFRREHFQPRKWTKDMMSFTGYLVTDTATSLRDEGCYSVVAYLLLDAVGNYYLADIRVGHMRPAEFIDAFFSVLEYWSNRCNHCGEVWERISMTTWAQSMLSLDQRSRKLRLKTIETSRAGAEQKPVRIDRLEPIMREHRFWVLDTVPRHFTDLDGQKLLYDANEYRDTRTGMVLPAGELVDEFIRLRAWPKTDIADAIALIVENNNQNGKPYCQYRQPSQALLQRAGLTEGYAPNRTTSVPSLDAPGGDWWERMTRGRF